MNIKPTLFSGPMVRAILDGRKKQTRRIVKPQSLINADGGLETDAMTAAMWRRVNRELPESFGATYFCPYGQPGDLLWVREAWGKVQMQHLMSPTPGRVEEAVTYRAGRLVLRGEDRPFSGSFDQWPRTWDEDYPPSDGRWRPSIHMPRWASRLTLEITDVRVERVQDISTPDAIAEGVEWQGMGQAIPAFQRLWDSIYGSGSWNENPWVWALTFKPHPQTRGTNHETERCANGAWPNFAV